VTVEDPGIKLTRFSNPRPSRSPDPDPGILALIPADAPRATGSRRAGRRRTSRGSVPPYLREKKRTNKTTFLYRFYDTNDVLLYVGITDNLIERTWSHARASTWMEFAVRSTVERHAKRPDAEAAEIAAIQGERPLFNLAYNDDKDGDRRLVDYLLKHDRRDLLRADVSRG
jgi:predicted GIY-YIG superfamily endonuclease